MRKKKPKPLKRRIDAVPDELIGKALKANLGLQYLAAGALGMADGTISDRIKESPYLQMIVQECREARIDAAERNLSKLVDNNNLGAVCFLLKTLGKNRGYIETSQQLSIPKEYEEQFHALMGQFKKSQDSLNSDDTSTSKEQKS